MTEEEIKDLEGLRPAHPESVTGYIAKASAAIPRLLEERKRLLEALRRSRHYGPIVVASGAEAAIAFAEEPAGGPTAAAAPEADRR